MYFNSKKATFLQVSSFFFFYRALHLKQFFSLQTRKTASWLAAELSKEGHQVALLSGEMVVEQRAAVIERFREGKEKVLVTTNVCARGEQRLGPGPPGSGPQRDRVWEAAVVWGRRCFVGEPVGLPQRRRTSTEAGSPGWWPRTAPALAAPARRQLLLQMLGSSGGCATDAGVWPAAGRPRPLPLGPATCPCPSPRAGLSQTLPSA